ncbi:MAG: hypothetical protein GEU81_01875 [Nitriliruptorales bacterium]|nr:hypothetical protein [Nitriliruptorales bacterium]
MKSRRRFRLVTLLMGVTLASLAVGRHWRARRAERAVVELSGAPYPLPTAGRQMPGPVENAQVLGPPSEPALFQALAGWVPDPPRSTPARVLAYAWASPMSLAGLLVGMASGARPRIREGVVLFPGAEGLSGWMLRTRGFQATALGHVVIARGNPNPSLLAHELVHVRHAERLGPLFAPLYGALWLAYGYARHPMERAARLGGRRAHVRGMDGLRAAPRSARSR